MSQLAQATAQTQQQTINSSLTKSNQLQHTAIIPIHSPVLQRCSNGVECPECRQKRLERESTLQRAAVNSAPTNGVPPIVHNVLNSPGQPLDAGTRAFMEPRFGHDFSRVRVHTDARAADSARSVNALAYTVGQNVVFGDGMYAPETSEGRRLVAHELTHVVQQGKGYGHQVQHKLEISEPTDASEYEAEHNARLVETDRQLTAVSPVSTLARAKDTTTVTVTAPTGPNICSLNQHQKIFPAVTQARNWLDQTFTRLSSYIANPPANTGVGNALNRHFRSTDAAVAQHVLGRVSSIRNMLNDRNMVTECHDNKDTSCPDAGAYVEGNLLVFCPSFFEGSNLWQAGAIVHEMAHALTGGQHIADRGYITDRIYTLLSRDEALTNAESYSFFVRQVGSGVMPDIKAPQDTQEDCDAKGFPGWSEQIKKAIARAQRWNRDALVWANDRRSKSLDAGAALRRRYLGNDALATLDLASKAYTKLESGLNESIDFECEPEGGGRCKDATTYWYVIGHFHICPSWTKFSEDDRILAMLAGLYGYKGDVDDNRRRWQYAKMAQIVTNNAPQPVV